MINVEASEIAYQEGSPVLRGVNFSISKGDRVAVLGASGSGKTTLIRHINEVILNRESEGEGEFRAYYLPQLAQLIPWKRTLSNIRFLSRKDCDTGLDEAKMPGPPKTEPLLLRGFWVK